MQLLPLSLCLLTLTGSTFSDGNGPVIIRATEGDEVTLPCYINKNIESERFDWKKDGKKKVYLYEVRPLPRDQDDQFKGRVSQLKNGDASITISDTKVSDSGVYTCNFPNLNQTFTVRLHVGPVIVRVKEGDNVILPCKINEDIEYERFEWKKDGKKDVYLHETYPLSGQDDEFRGRVSHFNHELRNRNASITINDTKVSDSGDYTCDFPNLHQTFTVRLVVVGELKDRSREFQCKAAKVSILNPEQTEDGFLLQCLVSDVSPGFKLNISWFDSSGNKLIEQINNTESEKTDILQTTVKKSDTYRCVATMEELSHQVHSEVQVSGSNIPLIVGLVILAVMAPIIVAVAGVIYKMKRPVIVKVEKGSHATLPCNIKNNILSKRFKWKKDGKDVYFLHEDGLLPVQDDEFRGRVSQLNNGDASITISDTKVTDSGVYTCHFLCFQTSTVHLRVDSRIIMATEGDEATLPCKIKNIKSERFEWRKGGKKVYLHGGGQLSGDQDDQLRRRVSLVKNGDASIKIINTKESDSGFYTCHFPNLHQTFSVYLRVEKRRECGPKERSIIAVKKSDGVTVLLNIYKDIDGKEMVYLDEDDQFRGRVSLNDESYVGNASKTSSDTEEFVDKQNSGQTFPVHLRVDEVLESANERMVPVPAEKGLQCSPREVPSPESQRDVNAAPRYREDQASAAACQPRVERPLEETSDMEGEETSDTEGQQSIPATLQPKFVMPEFPVFAQENAESVALKKFLKSRKQKAMMTS